MNVLTMKGSLALGLVSFMFASQAHAACDPKITQSALQGASATIMSISRSPIVSTRDERAIEGYIDAATEYINQCVAAVDFSPAPTCLYSTPLEFSQFVSTQVGAWETNINSLGHGMDSYFETQLSGQIGLLKAAIQPCIN